VLENVVGLEMVYQFHSRLRHTGTRMKEVAGEPVDVVRPSGGNISGLMANPILQDAEEIVPGVSVTRIENQEWAFDVADYDFGSGPVLPERGDTLTRSTGEEFRMVSPGGNDPVYRFTTSGRSRFIVTTERVKR